MSDKFLASLTTGLSAALGAAGADKSQDKAKKSAAVSQDIDDGNKSTMDNWNTLGTGDSDDSDGGGGGEKLLFTTATPMSRKQLRFDLSPEGGGQQKEPPKSGEYGSPDAMAMATKQSPGIVPTAGSQGAQNMAAGSAGSNVQGRNANQMTASPAQQQQQRQAPGGTNAGHTGPHTQPYGILAALEKLSRVFPRTNISVVSLIGRHGWRETRMRKKHGKMKYAQWMASEGS
mmetsp:Transcript_37471/g.79045  ORF Transcript_37471/g.79045 Transcript_37471/m.79045 type:complete len:231 (-) Transcript_37471:665-1357(-)